MSSLQPLWFLLYFSNVRYDIVGIVYRGEGIMDTKMRIKELMDERGWTIYELAKRSGLAQTTLSNMWKRNTEPTIPSLRATGILCSLGCPVHGAKDNDNELGCINKMNLMLTKAIRIRFCISLCRKRYIQPFGCTSFNLLRLFVDVLLIA